MKRGAFCAGLWALLGDLLALVVHGGRLAFVVAHDHQVLVRTEARILSAQVRPVLVIGLKNANEFEAGRIVQSDKELPLLPRRHPVPVGDGGEIDLNRSRHVALLRHIKWTYTLYNKYYVMSSKSSILFYRGPD